MDDSRDALMTELTTVDVLIIDDFALEPMIRDESPYVYQLFVDRNARLPTIVTRNRDTADWLAALDDTVIAQSAVDRFKANAYDLVIDASPIVRASSPVVPENEPPPAAPVVKQVNASRRRRPPSTQAPAEPSAGLDVNQRRRIYAVGRRDSFPGPMPLSSGCPTRVASGTMEATDESENSSSPAAPASRDARRAMARRR